MRVKYSAIETIRTSTALDKAIKEAQEHGLNASEIFEAVEKDHPGAVVRHYQDVLIRFTKEEK